jgi:hypothetical protein
MHDDRRREDFYDPWDENGPVKSERTPARQPDRQLLLSTLMQGMRGVFRTLPTKRPRPPS